MENFCSLEKNGLSSKCLAENLRGRKTCGFYDKSKQRDDCMYYVFDEFCDCLKAQQAECCITPGNGNGNGYYKKDLEEIEQEEEQHLLLYNG